VAVTLGARNYSPGVSRGNAAPIQIAMFAFALKRRNLAPCRISLARTVRGDKLLIDVAVFPGPVRGSLTRSSFRRLGSHLVGHRRMNSVGPIVEDENGVQQRPSRFNVTVWYVAIQRELEDADLCCATNNGTDQPEITEPDDWRWH